MLIMWPLVSPGRNRAVNTKEMIYMEDNLEGTSLILLIQNLHECLLSAGDRQWVGVFF